MNAVWIDSHRFDPRGKRLADRHYNRQNPRSDQFVPPGSCVVLLTPCLKAVWVTSWPNYVRHKWKGAWINTLFRNEGAGKSSDLINAAIEKTLEWWDMPKEGIISFVDPRYVPGILVRGKRIFGYCYKKAGFEHVGFTETHKLWVWHRTR